MNRPKFKTSLWKFLAAMPAVRFIDSAVLNFDYIKYQSSKLLYLDRCREQRSQMEHWRAEDPVPDKPHEIFAY
jgi:hypothetical protein